MNNYLSRPRPALLGMALLLILSASSWAASPTAFTYQGRLAEEGQPANGIYDFRFVIRDALIDGNQLRGTQTKLGVQVRDGVFTVAIDFGSSVFDGEVRWLDIGTRTNGGSTFTSLTPLQPIRPTPIAIAANVLNGTVTASQLTGSLGSAALAGSYENPLRFNSPSNSFTGDGSSLRFGGFSFTNLPFYWNTKGNAGTTPGLQFLGTLDAQPLELRVNNQRVLRLEPTSVSPNLIGGFGGNYADAGTIGSTIGGGGTADAPNRILHAPPDRNAGSPEFDTIGGGLGNAILGASHVTIGGGAHNLVDQFEWPFPSSPKFHSVIAGGASNVLRTAWMSTISGGIFNKMRGELGNSIYGATIGGGVGNTFGTITYDMHQPTIAGGYLNAIAQANYTTIGGGIGNLIDHDSSHASIGGGGLNHISAVTEDATISGGFSNRISLQVPGGTIGGGVANLIQNRARYAIIAGGLANGIGEEANGAVISGGESNQANGPYGTVSGGAGNLIQSNTFNATIGGGSGNRVEARAENSTIGGGTGNEIRSSGVTQVRNGTIAGGGSNIIGNGADDATVGGGSGNLVNQYAKGSLIAGGRDNTISDWCTDSVISGGSGNYMGLWYAMGAVISGGVSNRVGKDSFYSTIGGGAGNSVTGHNSYGVTVSGGLGNGIGSETWAATIGGGASNRIRGLASSGATIAGGSGNRIASIAYGATIGGGGGNTIGRFESSENIGPFGWYAVISGGLSNRATAPYSTVAGGRLNVAGGSNSFAAGYRAQATNDGTFVWADLQEADFTSTGTNQFLIRASGGVGIGTESPQFALHVNGDAGKPGGGAWSVASDERLKKDIRPLEQALARLLQLHGVTYEYKDAQAIHELPGQQTGLIAQEVEKVFPEWVESGRDGMKRLSVRGFEALAVEALRELRAEKDAQIRSMEKRLAAIEAKLAGDDGK